ncbi:MAG TPA: hypothetical protein VFF53_13220 [Geobacteraceae bacterium]|nr:hypothetical protein [Geobacteraceae bacterium]
MAADPLSDYLARRSAGGPWSLDLSDGGPISGGIIIPSLAESSSLPVLLESLCADHTLPSSGLAVVFVVNNRDDAPASEKDDNQRTLSQLRHLRSALPFPVGIVDAASPGLCLPLKDGGVGLARKLGHDLLLPRLDFNGTDPLLISLDADTLVEPGYAGSLVDHFRTAAAGGAVIPFAHQSAETDREESAIVRYELFLRCYVAGLEFAGSPYAFHTVGSAMACRASAYLKCGGMNRRRAGEDFYFLQSLAKTSGVQQVGRALVRPSPRRSGRVPFGTGRAMGALLDNEPGAVLFYRPECYQLLQGWIALASEGCLRPIPDLAGEGRALSPHLYEFLCEQQFPAAWDCFLRQHKDGGRRLRAVYDWFDAFRTMKFFHFLADGPYPRCAAEEVVASWPEIWGDGDLSPEERLELLRRRQN